MQLTRTFISWFVARAPALRFLLRFGALLGAFYVVMNFPVVDRAFYQYLCVNARVSNALLHALGQDTAVADVTIHSARYSVSIRRGCDAIEPAWFFCAAVLAFPAPWRRKLTGLAAGTAFILLLNLARIVSLYFIGMEAPAYFATAHLELWPAAFILTALLLWIGWIRWSRSGAPPSHAAS